MIKVVFTFLHKKLPDVLLLFNVINFDQKCMLNTNRDQIFIKFWNQNGVANSSSFFNEFLFSHDLFKIFDELFLAEIAFILDKFLESFVIRFILFSFTLISENGFGHYLIGVDS